MSNYYKVLNADGNLVGVRKSNREYHFAVLSHSADGGEGVMSFHSTRALAGKKLDELNQPRHQDKSHWVYDNSGNASHKELVCKHYWSFSVVPVHSVDSSEYRAAHKALKAA